MKSDVAFVSMSGRDSAMWFSYTGLYHALEERGVSCTFYFPSVDPISEIEYRDEIFFYDLHQPVKSARSVRQLARMVKAKHSRVILFSQGAYSALFVSALGFGFDVISWGHEIEGHIKRAGFFRGLNYYFSDRIVSLYSRAVIVSSTNMVGQAKRIFNRKFIAHVPLPLSGDFHAISAQGLQPQSAKAEVEYSDLNSELGRLRSVVRIVFFGCITGYKGLRNLEGIIDLIQCGKVELAILGRGDLKKHAPRLAALIGCCKNIVWVNEFLDASKVASELKRAHFMYVMYDSVTATSQVDIANALGVPVIASRLPFFLERITDGVNGQVLAADGLRSFIDAYLRGEVVFSGDRVEYYYREFGVSAKCVNSLMGYGFL